MLWPFINKTPIKLQIEPIECGAICLAIILEYLKKPVSLIDVKKQASVSRNGSSAASIINAAQSFGIDAKAKKILPHELKKIRLGILFFDNGHFVVYEGYFFNRFYINDPAKGRYSITLLELRQRYGLVCIKIRKTKEFKKRKKEKNIKSGIGSINKSLALLSGVLFALIASLLSFSLAGLIEASIYFDESKILWNTKVLFISVVLIIALFISVFYFKMLITQEYKENMQDKFFNYLAKQNVAKFNLFARSFLHYMIFNSGNTVIHQSFNNFNKIYFIGAMLGFICVPFLTSKTLAMNLFFYVLIGCFLYVLLIVIHKKKNFLNELYAFNEQKLLKESCEVYNDINAMGQNSFLVDRIVGLDLSFLKELIRLDLIKIITVSLYGIAFIFLFFNASFRESLAFFFIAVFFVLVTKTVLAHKKQILNTHWVNTFFDDCKHMHTSEQKRNDMNFCHDYLLKNINITYRGETSTVLNKLSLKIESNSMVGVVGTPSSGKSTLLRVLGKRIFYEDNDYLLSNKKTLFIDDYPSIVAASLKDNLTLFEKKISSAAILEALKKACAQDLFYNRPFGLLTPINEGGANLSQGEKKRLMLTRGFLFKANIFILDDFFASLEEPLSIKILRHIKQQKITTIFTSFRSDELDLCDKVIVLDKGNIINEGLHTELLKDKRYKAIITDAL